MRHLLLVAVGLSLACGPSDDGTSSTGDSQPEAAGQQAGQKKPGYSVVWPEDRGPRPNVRTDTQSCKKQVAEANPELADKPAESFKRVRDCLEAKGWIYKFL